MCPGVEFDGGANGGKELALSPHGELDLSVVESHCIAHRFATLCGNYTVISRRVNEPSQGDWLIGGIEFVRTWV